MEVELKFLLSEQNVTAFEQVILDCPFQVDAKPLKQLRNAYYDTPELDLRNFDIGFRTRSCQSAESEGYFEQTVKLAGQDLGGLHQRPEYNIRYQQDESTPTFPDLRSFDSDIWPSGFDTDRIQSQLQELFATDFERKTWDVTLWDGTVVECVLDRGAVIAREQQEPICEVELELVKGKVSSLFQLAKYIAANIGVRLGGSSKAARGYRLAAGKELKSSNLEINHFTQDVTVEQALSQLLSHAVKFLQHNEIVFQASNSPRALRRVIDGVSLISHVLSLFASTIKSESFNAFSKRLKQVRKELSWVDAFYQLKQLSNRQSPYRKDIEKNTYLSELLANHRMSDEKTLEAKRFLESTEFSILMLDLVEWSSQKLWRTELDLKELKVLAKPLVVYSSDWLTQAWQNLKQNLVIDEPIQGPLNIEKLYWPLTTELMTGLCVGSLYNHQDWQGFRNPLVDLLVGCEEYMLLSTLNALLLSQEDDEETQKSHIQWVESKQQSLQIALEASITNLSKLKTYW